MTRTALCSLMLAVLLLAALFPAKLFAEATVSEEESELARYREMLSDPFSNPGYLSVDRGEELWNLPRGKKNKSLESCDLGEGPGMVAGAYAKLPRYFEDAGRVMDLEERLLWCMTEIQGLDITDVLARRFSAPGKNSDMEDLTAFVANQSNGFKIQPQLSRPEEQKMFEAGRELFYRRSSIMDFSCATCHGEEGKRIRLQALPNFAAPGKSAMKSIGTWPAYRVSQSALRTLEHRLWDCYRQMRMPPPAYGSDAITALTLYLAKMAEGATINVPSIKR